VADELNYSIRQVELATNQVTTIAGSHNESATRDGVGGQARFNVPKDIALSPDGRFALIADVGAKVIRRLDLTTLAVSTLAGAAGQPGQVDGVGAARFNGPFALTISPDGSYALITEFYAHYLRRLDLTTLEVSTFVGEPFGYGRSDGVGAAARFAYPAGVAISPDGQYALVADWQNGLIRRIEVASRSVSTLAGAYGSDPTDVDGVGVAARFASPGGIAISADGRYALVTSGRTVRRLDLTTTAVTTIAGQTDDPAFVDGPGPQARFTNAEDVALAPDGSFALVIDAVWVLRKLGAPDPIVAQCDEVAVRQSQLERIVAQAAQVGLSAQVAADPCVLLPQRWSEREDTSFSDTTRTITGVSGQPVTAVCRTVTYERVLEARSGGGSVELRRTRIERPFCFADDRVFGSTLGTNLTAPTTTVTVGSWGALSGLSCTPGNGQMQLVQQGFFDPALPSAHQVVLRYQCGLAAPPLGSFAEHNAFQGALTTTSIVSTNGVDGQFNFLYDVSDQPPPQQSLQVSGRVYDQRTGAGRQVTMCLTTQDAVPICEVGVQTDAQGNYTIPGLAPGGYFLYPCPTGANAFPCAGGRAYAPTYNDFILDTSNLVADFYLPIPQIWTKTEAVAHRGDRVSSPENSATAVRRAVEKDARYIEIDVLLGSDGQIVVAHGSLYKDEKGGDIVTQVYGPTSACFGRNLESDFSLQSMLRDCDIGTEMMILPGQGLGSTWNPSFKDERYPTLAGLFGSNPGFCGWMIELKKSEHPSEPTDARNRQLGATVQSLLESQGLVASCKGRLWVTSFEDTALDGVTNPDILKMRQVSLLNPIDDWEGQVNNAIIRGYDALNVDNTVLDDSISLLGGLRVPDYIRSKGVQVSAHFLVNEIIPTGGGGTLRAEQRPEDNQEAIDKRADFFMTDILDDLLVRTRERNPAHRPHIEYQHPTPAQVTCTTVITNEEVFPIDVYFRAFDGNTRLSWPGTDMDGYYTLNARGLSEVSLVYNKDKAEITVSRVTDLYEDGSFTPNRVSEPLVIPVTPAFQQAFATGRLRVETIVRHGSFDNVAAKHRFTSECGDDLVVRANDIELARGSNPAIVGKTCVEANQPQVAKEIALDATLRMPSSGAWGVVTATMRLDTGEVIGQFDGGGALPQSATFAIPPEVRDLPAGERTITIQYAAQQRSSGFVRVNTVEQKFTVKVKACLRDKDIMLVLDGSGSIPTQDFDLIKSFSVRLARGLELSPTAANLGVVQFSSNARIESPLTDSVATLEQRIQQMVKLDSGTDIDAGINLGQAQFAASRPNYGDVIIVVTDGQGSGRTAAAAAKAAGITVISVGVGSGIIVAELQAIASGESYVFTVRDFDDLVLALQGLLPAESDPLR